MNNNPILLSEKELGQVIGLIKSPKGLEFGSARICRRLARNHSVPSIQVNTDCCVNNISDQVNTCINPRIAKLGLRVACQKPFYPIKNEFGQTTSQVVWSFYKVPVVLEES